MPAKEIKELRKAGKTDEAYAMAKAELDESISAWTFAEGLSEEDKKAVINSDNKVLWARRNISWVLFDYLKASTVSDKLPSFLKYLTELYALDLPADEKILYDQIAWQIGKIVFDFQKPFQKKNGEKGINFQRLMNHESPEKALELLGFAQRFPFTIPSEAYSFLFKAFHKALKNDDGYLQLVDWWGLENFRKEDFEKENMTDGKEIMSIAEQAYIAYAKHLLPENKLGSQELANLDKIKEFLPKLDKVIDEHPEYQYPPYFKAKLLLVLGDKEHMLSALLPFARKKMNDFWVWEVLSEAVNDEDQILSCYCKALLCRTSEEFLVGIRQRIASLMVKKKLYPEAKKEIELLVAARTEKQFKIPVAVVSWMKQDWFETAPSKDNNLDFYKQHQNLAEALLFSDFPDEEIVVDFVNADKKILNFVSVDNQSGFFKYDRFINDVNIGDILKVRFKEKKAEGPQQVYSITKASGPVTSALLVKSISGTVRIGVGKNFGFIDDVYIHPSTVRAANLTNGITIKGQAVKTYNSEKKQWGWKLFKIEN